MPAKRPRKSGLTGIELLMAVNAIQTLLDKSREEQALNKGDQELEDSFNDETEHQQLEGILKMLRSRVDGPQSYSFSSMTQDHLDKMDISASGLLELKPDAISRGVKKDVLGADSLWSSDMLCRHLQFLEGLVPRNVYSSTPLVGIRLTDYHQNEGAARLWIKAFFYRVAHMIPTGSNVVLSVEQVVPSVTVSDTSAHTLSGYIDWTAMVMPPQKAHLFLRNPILQHLRNDVSALFISEAKGPDQLLGNHVQQTIGEMLACARTTG
ncbi:hypothetical protein HGRIS_010937 [Hohenbuehelia grisea]|uniref:Uncharacterized protein n=1 Tax=Hohenbuehelia grisea TaxID=104357 RepID=A0ABR3IYG4_9AGAR